MSSYLPEILGISPMLIFIPLLLSLLYYSLLPKPIPGIPYNRTATLTPLGDIPFILRSISTEGNDPFFFWFAKQHTVHNSPVVQVFTRLFRKPAVFVADYREAEDVLTRRTAEFDRAQFFTDIFTGTAPHGFSIMRTDATFKAQRRLSLETMTPTFLKGVALTKLYGSAQNLMTFWKQKAEPAGESAWNAEEDVHRAVFDGLWRVMYGTDVKVLETQLLGLQGEACIDRKDGVTIFPHVPEARIYHAILEKIDSTGDVMQSPAPILHHRFLRTFTKLRSAYKVIDENYSQLCKDRLPVLKGAPTMAPESAFDSLMLRNFELGQKGGHMIADDAIKDDLFAIMGAGIDTTATTMIWCLKYLSLNPSMQSTLRKEIVSALTTSTPSVETIKESKIPYLDAFIEELLRLCQPAPFVSRGALVDTEILGYKIPKDTEVFFATNAASILQPAYDIEEKLRSTTCRTAVYRTGAWDPADIGVFKPERWLKTDEKGEVYFDAKAGPILAFGLGTRGCFGKRFAYQQLRLLIVLLVTTFELLGVPEELGSMKAVQKLVRGPEMCYVRLRML